MARRAGGHRLSPPSRLRYAATRESRSRLACRDAKKGQPVSVTFPRYSASLAVRRAVPLPVGYAVPAALEFKSPRACSFALLGVLEYLDSFPGDRAVLSASDALANRLLNSYRANRAVIFDSDLFHATDRPVFRDGYLNRRINITFLYGRRTM